MMSRNGTKHLETDIVMAQTDKDVNWEQQADKRINSQLVSALVLNVGAWAVVALIAYSVMG